MLKALEKAEEAYYDQLKWAVLDRYEITPETYRQRLHTSTLPEGVQLRAVRARLKDAATRWLKPRTDDGPWIVDLIVIEEILSVLPHRVRHWLACWHPERLPDVQELWENFTAADGRELMIQPEGTRGEEEPI